MEEAYRAGRRVEVGDSLAVPIRLRGAVLGVLQCRLRRPEMTVSAAGRAAGGDGGEAAKEQPEWVSFQQQVNFLEAVADQLALALDSARLYAQSRQLAEQERLVGEITGRMRRSLDVETVVRTAVDEIYQALDLQALTIQLVASEAEGGDRVAKERLEAAEERPAAIAAPGPGEPLASPHQEDYGRG
jgi:GAF domain-containing protein